MHRRSFGSSSILGAGGYVHHVRKRRKEIHLEFLAEVSSLVENLIRKIIFETRRGQSWIEFFFVRNVKRTIAVPRSFFAGCFSMLRMQGFRKPSIFSPTGPCALQRRPTFYGISPMSTSVIPGTTVEGNEWTPNGRVRCVSGRSLFPHLSSS